MKPSMASLSWHFPATYTLSYLQQKVLPRTPPLLPSLDWMDEVFSKGCCVAVPSETAGSLDTHSRTVLLWLEERGTSGLTACSLACQHYLKSVVHFRFLICLSRKDNCQAYKKCSLCQYQF
ncbi:hypothetical protein I79_026127 [Cricetulus griseus]|uniref:Uncharacterized protein n=1 Tax=Cricetulus griseus TaxID=10029 RepID=G3IQ38_CRIGR|nr:hypothetical protein I79_026127 [Cricetulus griseus]